MVFVVVAFVAGTFLAAGAFVFDVLGTADLVRVVLVAGGAAVDAGVFVAVFNVPVLFLVDALVAGVLFSDMCSADEACSKEGSRVT